MTQAPTEVKIRKATAQDAPWVVSVLHQAFAEYFPLYTKEGYAATTPDVNEVLRRIEQDVVWVALVKECLSGTVSAVVNREGLYVRSMAVIPAARGLRIGHLLLDEIERFAAMNRCNRLFLSTTPFLHRAIRLYEACGFQRTTDGPSDLFGTPLFTMEKILAIDAGLLPAEQPKPTENPVRCAKCG